MASNADKIIARYGDGSREENRSSGERADYNMEYKYTKRILDKYITNQSNVLEIGCGTGYYGIYLSDKCSSYTGFDITPGNIILLNKKINELNLSNVTGIIGDATDMLHINNEIYDIIMCFGPMYHLPTEESENVFKECKRICKNNGIILYAYINKIGVYMNGCFSEPDIYPNKIKNESILIKGIDDTRDNIYWFMMPEDMENLAIKYNLQVIDNLGVDFGFTPEIYNDDKRDSWDELIDFLSTHKSCTGFANHAIMICRK